MRVGLLGAGKMGSNHARIIAASGHSTLHRVVDSNADSARQLAYNFSGRWSTNVDDLLSCDAVVVASPTEHHLAAALPLLAGGVALLVEKPLAGDQESVDALVAGARQSRVPMMCGFVERFNAAVLTGLGALTAPPSSFHSVRHSPAASRITTSVVTDLLIHDIDLITQAIPDRFPVTVSAVVGSPEGALTGEQVDAVVAWANGPVANLSASRLGQRKVRTLSITSPNELVEVDLLRQNVTVYRHVTHDLVDGAYRSDTIVEIPFVRHAAEPLALQFDHFAALVKGDVDRVAELASLVASHRVAFEVEAVGVRVALGALAS